MRRLRQLRFALRLSAQRLWLALDIEKPDVLVLIGLVLIGAGFWRISHALAFIVPGAILLWLALPPRPPFIDRPSTSRGGRP